MTIREYIEGFKKTKKILEKVKENGTHQIDDIDVSIEQCKMAIEALEKQIPKKPMDCNGERMCECGNIVKSYQKYCYECGQRLDWSEDNDV